jgi:hypothetical protein
MWKTPSAYDPALEEVVRRLVKVCRPGRIYLFGPVARGDAPPDSDIDMMVAVPDDTPPEGRRAEKGYAAVLGLGAPAGFHVWRKGRFDGQLRLRASFPATAVDVSPPIPEGVVFHCQQAVEEVLEAFLTWHDGPSGKTAWDPALAPLVKVADSLPDSVQP